MVRYLFLLWRRARSSSLQFGIGLLFPLAATVATLAWQAKRGLIATTHLADFVITTILPVAIIWFFWVVVQLTISAMKLHRSQERIIATKQQLLDLNRVEQDVEIARARDSHRRRAERHEKMLRDEAEALRNEVKQLRAASQAEVLATIDDRVRIVSGMLFDSQLKSFHESFWLVGPITIENRKSVTAAVNGYLEASHSMGTLRFSVEAIPFEHWPKMIRTTHQASAPQLMLPINIAARDTIRGIALIRFPRSELGGLGAHHEPGQKIRFVLTLNGTEGHWVTTLRLPFEWNPQPVEKLFDGMPPRR